MSRIVFGHNSNIKFGANTFHVQTEDRGASHALIDTTVYYQGRVLHRRTNNYLDLLPLTDDTMEALKLRVDDQHSHVLEEIRKGELQLTVPAGVAAKKVEQVAEPAAKVEQSGEAAAPVVTPSSKKLVLALLNARSWLAGKQANLLVLVNDEGGKPAAGVRVIAEVEGSAGHPPYASQTGGDGQATISFEMPKITGAEAALVIRTEDGAGGAHLRFSLRAKPRVPAV